MAYDIEDALATPVSDWLSDWDWLDPSWGTNAPEIWEDIRSQGCPMAHTERYGSAWMPVTAEAVSAIAYDTEHFSSAWVSVARPDTPRRPAPPITSDPPDHHGHRRLLLPAFSPKPIARLEGDTRDFCRSLVAALRGKETADAAVDYVQHVPVHVIARLLGVPESDADLFRDWIFRNFQLAPRDNAVKVALIEEMTAYFADLLEQRCRHPADDLATFISGAEIDGEPVSDDLKVGYMTLLILAGIDTTWSAIGSGIWHLATHEDDRKRLTALHHDDPLWSTFTEEVLRYYAPVTMARRVIEPTEVVGVRVEPGDQILVTFPAANRDPAVFDRADEFVIDRAVNRHIAFGLGIHRCLGSNLARLEMVVAFQEWMSAFPRFELDPAGEATWAAGQVRGPRKIPVLLHD